MSISDLINTPKYHYWTPGAIECYQRNSICKGCETFELLSEKCKMKYAVIKLIETIGKPEGVKEKTNIIDDTKLDKERNTYMFDQDLNLKYGESLKPIIDAIKKGYTSYPDLEKHSGIKAKLLSVYFNNFWNKLVKDNLINRYAEKTKKSAVIDFVMSRLIDRTYTETAPSNPIKTETKSDEMEETVHNLRAENEKLRKRISELENRIEPVVDFTKIRERIRNEIAELNAKLKALDLIEAEIAQ